MLQGIIWVMYEVATNFIVTINRYNYHKLGNDSFCGQ